MRREKPRHIVSTVIYSVAIILGILYIIMMISQEKPASEILIYAIFIALIILAIYAAWRWERKYSL